MTESSVKPDAQQLALEAVWELWADAKPASKIKEGSLPALQSLGIRQGMHEGAAYDPKLMDEWFLSQIYEAIEAERLNELGYLLNHTERYASKDFFGKNMLDVFDRAERKNAPIRRLFVEDHPESEDWLDSRREPQASGLFSDWLDRDVYKGRRMAFLVSADKPDLPITRVEGELSSKKDGILYAIYYIKTAMGRVHNINMNDVEAVRIKDISNPSYNEIKEELKKKYHEIDVYSEMPKGTRFSWLKPDPEKGIWSLIEATVVKPLKDTSSLFIVSANGNQEEINVNHFHSQGNRIFIKL